MQVTRRTFLGAAAAAVSAGRARAAYKGLSLDHVVLETSDVSNSADFYARYFGVPVIELGKGSSGVRLGSNFVGLTQGDPGMSYFAVAVAEGGGDERVSGEPDGLDVRVTPGGGASGAVIAEEAPDESLFRGRSLNHIALRVTDVAASRDFYRDTFGLSIIREGSDNCFLRLGENFIALFKADEPGMDHFCISIEKYDAAAAMKVLEEKGRNPHREANRVYFPDPDGIEVQLAAVGHAA